MATKEVKGKQKAKVKRPSLFLLATEGGRAIAELGLFYVAKTITKQEPEGNGEPVLVIPGFMTTDKATRPIRSFLKDLGYNAYGWEQGRNYGSYKLVVQAMERAKELYRKHGKKVNIIGWSLGGIYAREIAREIPEMINQVITLGSPFGGLKEDNNVAWLYHMISGEEVKDIDDSLLKDILIPPPVPVTAIYTKGDGIVSWEHCMEQEENANVQNVEVQGSHCGLAFNIAALQCIVNRLSQSKTSWEPFRPSSIQAKLYPNLARA